MVVSSCRELDNNRSALSAASAFAIATAGANEGTPTKEKYRRMSLASTGQSQNEVALLKNTAEDYMKVSCICCCPSVRYYRIKRNLLYSAFRNFS